MGEDKSRSKVFDVLQKCFGHIWGEFNEDQLTVRQFRSGFANEVYYCAINDVEGKIKDSKEVVVRFNGREDSGGIEEMIINDESALALLACIMGEKKMGPKIFVIFPGGRIEEFIDSTLITGQQVRSERVLQIIGRQLARKHHLDVPLPRVNGAVAMLSRLDTMTMSAGATAMVETMKVNVFEERKWMREMLSKLKSKLVFCHGDMNRHNILVRKTAGDELTDDDIVVIDYDGCCYSHPCYDIAFYLYNFTYTLTTVPPFLHNLDIIATEEEKHVLIREYLREKRKITGCQVDENEEDNMSVETDFFSVMTFLFLMSMFLPRVDSGKDAKIDRMDLRGMVTTAETNYIKSKKEFFEKPNWKQIFNE